MVLRVIEQRDRPVSRLDNVWPALTRLARLVFIELRLERRTWVHQSNADASPAVWADVHATGSTAQQRRVYDHVRARLIEMTKEEAAAGGSFLMRGPFTLLPEKV